MPNRRHAGFLEINLEPVLYLANLQISFGFPALHDDEEAGRDEPRHRILAGAAMQAQMITDRLQKELAPQISKAQIVAQPADQSHGVPSARATLGPEPAPAAGGTEHRCPSPEKPGTCQIRPSRGS